MLKKNNSDFKFLASFFIKYILDKSNFFQLFLGNKGRNDRYGGGGGRRDDRRNRGNRDRRRDSRGYNDRRSGGGGGGGGMYN